MSVTKTLRSCLCILCVCALMSAGCVTTVRLRTEAPFVRWSNTRTAIVWITLPASEPHTYALVTVEDPVALRDSVIPLTSTVQRMPWTIRLHTAGPVVVRVEIYDAQQRLRAVRVQEFRVE